MFLGLLIALGMISLLLIFKMLTFLLLEASKQMKGQLIGKVLLHNKKDAPNFWGRRGPQNYE